MKNKLKIQEMLHEFNLEDPEYNLEQLFEDVERRFKPSNNISISNESFISKALDWLKNRKANKEKIKREIENNSLSMDNCYENLSKMAKKLKESINVNSKLRNNTIDLKAKEFKALSINNKIDNVDDSITKSIKYVELNNLLSPDIYFYKYKYPTIKNIINKNGITEEGMVKSYNEILNSKVLLADNFIKEYLSKCPLHFDLHEKIKVKYEDKGDRLIYKSKEYFIGNMQIKLHFEVKNGLLLYAGAGNSFIDNKIDNVVKALKPTEIIQILNNFDKYEEVVKEEWDKREDEWEDYDYSLYDVYDKIINFIDKKYNKHISDIDDSEHKNIKEIKFLVSGMLDVEMIFHELRDYNEIKSDLLWSIHNANKALYIYCKKSANNLLDK